MIGLRCLVSLGIVLAAGGWGVGAAAAAAAQTSPGPQAQVSETKSAEPEPVFGVGYHPGNFIGPLAFDVIVRPLRHLAVDVQAGYWSQDRVEGLGVAPQVQWEFLRGWQTPYAGLAFRYEEVWSGGTSAASRGGALTGGWQFRWRSGLGVLVGAGALYKTAVNLDVPGTIAYYSSGGLSGTYEVGVRYFF